MRRPSPLVMIGWELDAVTLPATRPRAWWERLLGLRAPHDADLLRPATPAARLLRYRDAAAVRPMYRDPTLELMREAKGLPYANAWRAWHFPTVRTLMRLQPVPDARPTDSTPSARGRQGRPARGAR